MLIRITPGRTITNGAAAGPVTSWRLLQAKAAALGVELAVCAEGVLLDGHVHAGLAEIDAELNHLAEAGGVDLGPAVADARCEAADARQRALARIVEASKRLTPFVHAPRGPR